MIVFDGSDGTPVVGTSGLLGRTVVITGGSQGIGLGVAHVLLSRGANVAICARTTSVVTSAAEQLGETGRVVGIALDLAERCAADALVDAVTEKLGPIHGLVACHGIFDRPAVNFLDFDDDAFAATIEVNLTSSFRVARAVARQMVSREVQDGRLVLVSSIDGIAAERHCVGYNASKAGVLGLTRGIALDLAPYGITCNAILPGWIRSPMTAGSLPADVFDGQAPFDLTPSNRLGVPEDIGEAAAFLCDPGSRYVTGTTLVVDGGQTMALRRPGASWA